MSSMRHYFQGWRLFLMGKTSRILSGFNVLAEKRLAKLFNHILIFLTTYIKLKYSSNIFHLIEFKNITHTHVHCSSSLLLLCNFVLKVNTFGHCSLCSFVLSHLSSCLLGGLLTYWVLWNQKYCITWYMNDTWDL